MSYLAGSVLVIRATQPKRKLIAMLALDMPTVEDSERVTSDESNYLGSGCYRTVYRETGSKWVFKVENTYSGRYSTNKVEYETYLQFHPSLQGNVKFPKMYLLDNGILAAEYIEGSQGEYNCWRPGFPGCDRDCEIDCWAKQIEFLSELIDDLHYQNVRVTPTGDVYIIDLGEGPRQR